MGSTENYLMIQAFRAVRKNLTERVELTKKKDFLSIALTNLRKSRIFRFDSRVVNISMGESDFYDRMDRWTLLFW